MRPPLRLLTRTAASLLVLATVATAQRKGGDEDWPFGIPAHAGGMTGPSKRDLFNLGPIGAKGWDADLPEPTGERKSGRRVVESRGPRGGDDGPKRLLIRAIFGGGPAQKAGLRLGDLVVGVEGRPFAEGSLGPLAEAITRAEAGGGKLTLQIERKGQTKTLTVRLPKVGKHAITPEKGKMRDQLLEDACRWLADHQQGGGFPETLSGTNGAVVMTCLAGLAWIGEGSSLKRGRYRANLESAVEFVLREVGKAHSPGFGGDANWDQTNWGYAHAAIFLGELQLHGKSRKLTAALQKVVDTLASRQEASGGYAHGPGGKNALGYLELNILSAYAASGLGVCAKAGCRIDDSVIDSLLGYCRESAGADGGVGYSTSPGQRGMGNIGRTAGTWLGARGLGRGGDPFARKMEEYVRRNIGAVLDGHASLQQHILLAGLAAVALGGDAPQRYWDSGRRRDLVLARAPDGSFQPRPWHESLRMGSNTDVSVGEVWSTASWAIVLAAHGDGKKGGLPGWCGRPTARAAETGNR